jgi:hypothetical protein
MVFFSELGVSKSERATRGSLHVHPTAACTFVSQPRQTLNGNSYPAQRALQGLVPDIPHQIQFQPTSLYQVLIQYSKGELSPPKQKENFPTA